MAHAPGTAKPPAARRSLSFNAHNRAKPHHPPTLTMVMQAVKALDEPKGASAFAIRRYILTEYPGVDPTRLKYYLKRALATGLEKGHLARPLRSTAQGAVGRFQLKAGKSKQGKASSSLDEVAAPKPGKVRSKARQRNGKTPAGKVPSKGAAREEKKVATRKRPPPTGAAKEEKKVATRKRPPKADHGAGAAKGSAEPKGKASKEKGAKPPKKLSHPKAPQAGPKEAAPKAVAKGKSPAEVAAKGAEAPRPGKSAKGADPGRVKGKTAKEATKPEAKMEPARGKRGASSSAAPRAAMEEPL